MTLLAFTLQQENSATMTMNVTAEGKDLDSSSHVLNKGEYNRKNVVFFTMNRLYFQRSLGANHDLTHCITRSQRTFSVLL